MHLEIVDTSIPVLIKTHGSELRDKGGSTLRWTHMNILQEQPSLKACAL